MDTEGNASESGKQPNENNLPELEVQPEPNNVMEEKSFTEADDSVPVEQEMNEIFGESEEEDVIDVVSEDEYKVDDSEDEAEDVNSSLKKKQTTEINSSKEDDIDYLLNRNKRYRRLQRKRNSSILDNRDRYAANVVQSMIEAANHDRKMNAEKKPSFGKLNLLPRISIDLLRPELAESLVDHGVFEALAAWLQVLPSGDLPMLSIRSKILNLILELPTPSIDDLKASGLGKIMTMLSRHPKEIRKNKKIAQDLIDKWIRPIYGLDESHETYKNSIKRVEINIEDLRKGNFSKSFNNNDDDAESEARPKPGDPNFVMRARAPQPSDREYKVRPVGVLNKTKSASFLRAKKTENTKKYFNRIIRKNSSSVTPTKAQKVNINGGKFFG